MTDVGVQAWNETLGLIFTSMPAPKIASGPESSFRTNDEILLPSTVFAQIQTLWTDHDSNYPILVKLLLTDVVSRFMLHREAPGFPPALAACCDPVEAVQSSCGDTVFSRSSVVPVNGIDAETTDPLLKALWSLWGCSDLLRGAASTGATEGPVRKKRLIPPFAQRYGKILNVGALLRHTVQGHPGTVAIPEQINPRGRTTKSERENIERALFKPGGTDEFNPANESVDFCIYMSVNKDSAACDMILKSGGPWKDDGFEVTLTTVDKVMDGGEKRHAKQTKCYFPVPNILLTALGKDVKGGNRAFKDNDAHFAEEVNDETKKDLTIQVAAYHQFIDDISKLDLLSLSAIINAHPSTKLTEEESKQAKDDANRIFGGNGAPVTSRQEDIVKKKMIVRKLLDVVKTRSRQRAGVLFDCTDEDVVTLLDDFEIVVSIATCKGNSSALCIQ